MREVLDVAGAERQSLEEAIKEKGLEAPTNEQELDDVLKQLGVPSTAPPTEVKELEVAGEIVDKFI